MLLMSVHISYFPKPLSRKDFSTPGSPCKTSSFWGDKIRHQQFLFSFLTYTTSCNGNGRIDVQCENITPRKVKM